MTVSTGFTKRKVSPVRVILFSLMMAALITAELYGYHTVFADFIQYLTDIDHKSCAWIGGRLSMMLPFITVCVFQYSVYKNDDCGDGVMQHEKAWEILLIAILIFGGLLPYVVHYSNQLHETALQAALLTGDTLPQTAGGVDETLILSVLQWFLELSIALVLLGAYHGIRAERETAEAVNTTSDDILAA